MTGQVVQLNCCPIHLDQTGFCHDDTDARLLVCAAFASRDSGSCILTGCAQERYSKDEPNSSDHVVRIRAFAQKP